MKPTYLILPFILALTACSTAEKRTTLRDIDIVSKNQKHASIYIKAKSDEEIRQAYEEYLKHATDDTSLRQTAINRLAELEFDLGNKIQKEKENLAAGGDDATDEKLYNARLDKTIELLSSSLRDFPKAKGNDKTMYQLAKAHDMKGEQSKTKNILEKLVKKPSQIPLLY